MATQSTTNFQPGDLVLLAFPYTSGTQSKDRPALILLDTGDADVVVARVTTQPASTRFDVSLAEWQASGLLALSTVRLHKVATLEKSRIRRVLGALQPADRQRVSAILNQMYASW